MIDLEKEIERRTATALNAIRASYGDGDEFGATIFVDHHLDEIEEEYWQKHLSKTKPDPSEVLSLLFLRGHWSGEDENGIEFFDFTLPDDVTQYVICVQFDEDGKIQNIMMES